MSQNINGTPIIKAEPGFICGICGKIAETRPYGLEDLKYVMSVDGRFQILLSIIWVLNYLVSMENYFK